MVAKQLFALGAVVALASAQSDPCSQSTITINSQSDITNLGTCQTLTGNVVVGTQTDTTLDFSAFQEIKGDFVVVNNPMLQQIKSSGISTITGTFNLTNLTGLSDLSFTKLSEVGTISWTALTAIDTLTFTTGIAKVSSVTISDTFLSSLDGLNAKNVDHIDINNNRRLVEWSSALQTVGTLVTMSANGLDCQVSFPMLQWASNMTISNVSSLSVPALTNVNGSLQLYSNFIESFSAPNLTSTGGDIDIVSNADLKNISFPVLQSVGAALLIANNTELDVVNDFGSLKTVSGTVKMRGNFTDVEFPKLNNVAGAFDIASTGNLDNSCKTFASLAPQSQGGGGQIQGSYSCVSGDTNANSDTSSTSNGTSSSSGNGNGGNSAAGVAVNMFAVLGLTVAGVFFHALL